MIKELHENAKSFSTIGNLLKETKQVLEPFVEYKTQHVLHMGNEVVYRLARYVQNVDNIEMW